MVRFLLLLVALAAGWLIAHQIGATASPELSQDETNDATPEIIVTVPDSQPAAVIPLQAQVRPSLRSEDPADAPRPAEVEIEASYSK